MVLLRNPWNNITDSGHYQTLVGFFPFFFSLTVYSGTAEHISNWGWGRGGGGLENEYQSSKFFGRFGGILPQKIFKSRASEMAFLTLSMRYTLKKTQPG